MIYQGLIFVFILRLPVVFFNVLCHKDPRIHKLLDVWDIVILSNVDATTSSKQKREAAPDYSHLQLLSRQLMPRPDARSTGRLGAGRESCRPI